MLRKTVLTTAMLFPTSAFAHSQGHEVMSLGAEVTHMLGDPLHLTLLGAFVTAGILAWKTLRKKPVPQN